MQNRHVIQKTIIALFLCYASTVNAQTNNISNAIRCPSLDSIHQAAPLLNQIEEKCRDGVCIYTGIKPAFHENGMPWGLLFYIKDSSREEATIKAQTTAANVGVMFSRFVWPFSCTYYVPSSDFSENEAPGLMAFPLRDVHTLHSFTHSLKK